MMARAETVAVNPERTIRIDGFIRDLQPQASALEDLVVTPEPVYLVINSPGGSVYGGLLFINAMLTARERGITVVCVVPNAAASMAFNILTFCDERYTLRYTLLLFHPITSDGAETAVEHQYIADAIRSVEQLMLRQLLMTMGMQPEQFLYHYKWGTLWTAEELAAVTSGFITIVDDIQGIKLFGPE